MSKKDAVPIIFQGHSVSKRDHRMGKCREPFFLDENRFRYKRYNCYILKLILHWY